MLKIAALMGLLAAPAAADVATVSGCEIKDAAVGSSIYCETSNQSNTALAAIEFDLSISQEGRTVPWFTERARASISGGVEPGETRRIYVSSVVIPKEANRDKLRVEVTPLRVDDINGSEISQSEAPS